MKKTIYLMALASALAMGIQAQVQPGPYQTAAQAAQKVEAQPDLPRFDLNFEGGTPDDLVRMLRGKLDVVNVIVPEEYRQVKLPAVTLQKVTLVQLFAALEQASRKRKPYVTGTVNYGIPGQIGNRNTMQERTVSMGFMSTAKPITEETVWTFYVEDVPELPLERTVQFFQLGPYLDAYKIDDITTAVQAGWKMLQEPANSPKPELNFHEETKLLIAAGTPTQLETIRSVLSQLWLGNPAAIDPNTGLPLPKPASAVKK